jgi:hypothetical protein
MRIETFGLGAIGPAQDLDRREFLAGGAANLPTGGRRGWPRRLLAAGGQQQTE